uniref:C-type lectin domain-containing protein n=1 Tax=Gadus morhua TaxID=8049 RepID=A0A8C5FA93_GADMO
MLKVSTDVQLKCFLLQDAGGHTTLLSFRSDLFVYEESNYIVVQNTMTWYEALQYCRSHYTDLAIVRNAAENGKVLALNPQSSWIGLHRHPWSHWSDGSSATFLNWAQGEPNNYGGSVSPRCAKLSVTSGSFLDGECGFLHNFACQRKLEQRSIFKLKISTEISTWKENCSFCHYVLLCLLEI